MLSGPYSAAILLPEGPAAENISVRDAVFGDIMVVRRHSKGVSRDTVCGVPMERLQDVSACFVCPLVCFVDDCSCNLLLCRARLSL
jgi:hypothetical protein